MSRDIDAEEIARALGGSKTLSGWIARCPAHDDRSPSLSIGVTDTGKVLVHCHAGCDQSDVIAALTERQLWPSQRTTTTPHPAALVASSRVDDLAQSRIEHALKLWHETSPADDTAVETYLLSRGMAMKPPATLRFHPALMHKSGDFWPAMVALVTRGVDDVPVAVHRTFLDRDGTRKAPVEPQKMMLGPCAGGAVRLGGTGDRLLVGEGIETTLAAQFATGDRAWSALSASGLKSLQLPKTERHIVILADADEPGEKAAQAASQRWLAEGRSVHIARPPVGLDFNDVLMQPVSFGNYVHG